MESGKHCNSTALIIIIVIGGGVVQIADMENDTDININIIIIITIINRLGLDGGSNNRRRYGAGELSSTLLDKRDTE